jgi:hypothetical protein
MKINFVRSGVWTKLDKLDVVDRVDAMDYVIFDPGNLVIEETGKSFQNQPIRDVGLLVIRYPDL